MTLRKRVAQLLFRFSIRQLERALALAEVRVALARDNPHAFSRLDLAVRQQKVNFIKGRLAELRARVRP